MVKGKSEMKLEKKKAKLETALRTITNAMVICGQTQRPVHECKGLVELMDYLEGIRNRALKKLNDFRAAHPELFTPPAPKSKSGKD
jgi:hypothetical protein